MGYIGVTTPAVEDWIRFASDLLGMQLVDATLGVRRFRMDDRRQRFIVNAGPGNGAAFYGWEVAGPADLMAFADHLSNNGIAVTRGSRALADERFVKDLIIFGDPAGNRVELFYGPELATDPFQPGRTMSGFRTGTLGMGHAVFNVTNVDETAAFYRDMLGFKLSDYITAPFRACFFHVNPRHHSLALIESTQNGIHHLMIETCMLDDVGQAYDLAQRQPDRIGTTLGRHVNDHMTSFYSWSPSRFLFELGWGGRSIDSDNWTPHERIEGPSLWGHDRAWLPDDRQQQAYDLRIRMAQAGVRAPLNVMDGNFTRASDACPWWNAAKTMPQAASGSAWTITPPASAARSARDS
ncbi:VOC family protein [Terripilifer ovatus]|uniref:VOC family protein n=1 Tax=Terripilifer ovatus TaxID=3032367 RepID=UPI003AB94C1C